MSSDDADLTYWMSLLGELGSNQDNQQANTHAKGNQSTSENNDDSTYLLLNVQPQENDHAMDYYAYLAGNSLQFEQSQNINHEELENLSNSKTVVPVSPELLAQAEAVPPPVPIQLEQEKQRELEQLDSISKIHHIRPNQRRPNMWLSDDGVDDDLGKEVVSEEHDILERVRNLMNKTSTISGKNQTPFPQDTEMSPERRPIIVVPYAKGEDAPSPVSDEDDKDHVMDSTEPSVSTKDVQVVDYPVQIPSPSKTSSLNNQDVVVKSRRKNKSSRSTGNMWQVSKTTLSRLQEMQGIAVAAWTQWETQILQNPYVAEALGMAAESLQVLLDRGHRFADEYFSSIIIGDDPEQCYLQRVRRGHVYEHVALRCSLSTLSFRQRQLLLETRVDTLPDAKVFANLPPTERQRIEEKLLLESMQRLSDLQALGQTISANNGGNNLISGLPLPLVNSGDNNSDETIDADDFQYLLARYLTPPVFQEKQECYVCHQQFGLTLFRHHCRHCGGSVCDAHSRQRRRIVRLGLVSPVRVCDQCSLCLDELKRVDQLVWRDGRVRAWLKGQLLPVTYSTLYGEKDIDRGLDKALRIADYSLSVARNALILNFPTKVALETIEVLKRYGLTGFAGLLLTGEFMEAIETLKQLVKVDDMFPSLHELTACVYYKLAIDRGLRGCQPDLVLETHRDTFIQRRMLEQLALLDEDNDHHNNDNDNVPRYDCRAATEKEVSLAIHYAPLALDVVYENNELDMRRLGRYHSLELLCSNVSAEENEELRRRPEQPVYALFVPQTPPRQSTGQQSASEVILSIRGTQSVQDVVTDIRTRPIRFPPADHIIVDLLRGHSLHSSHSEHSTSKDHHPNRHTEHHFLSGRNHPFDATDSTIEAVMQESRALEEAHQHKHHRSGAISTANNASIDNKNNNKNNVIGNEAEDAHSGLGEEYVCEGMARSALYIVAELGPALLRLIDSGCDLRVVGHSLGGAVAALVVILLRRGLRVLQPGVSVTTISQKVKGVAFASPSCLSAKLSDELLDRHYPANTYNSNSSNNNYNSSSVSEKGFLSVILRDDVICRVTPQSARQLLREILLFRNNVFRHLQQDWSDVMQRARDLWAPRVPRHTQNQHQQAAHGLTPQEQFSVPQVISSFNKAINNNNNNFNNNFNNNNNNNNNHKVNEEDEEEEEEDEEVVEDMWEEVDLWQPGEILHIYPWRGQWLGATVSRDFPPLRHIAVQGHIFEDHRSHNIFNALLETLHVQRLRSGSTTGPVSSTAAPTAAGGSGSGSGSGRGVPPPWTAFDCADKCACCLLSFTWHSTFRGAAQEFRERYNCRNCGALVCGPCSKQRKSIPRFGMLAPRRVCDRCFSRGDFSS